MTSKVTSTAPTTTSSTSIGAALVLSSGHAPMIVDFDGKQDLNHP